MFLLAILVAVLPAQDRASREDMAQVWRMLYEADCDLKEAIDVRKTETGLLVRGFSLSAAMREQLEKEVRGIPGIRLEFTEGNHASYLPKLRDRRPQDPGLQPIFAQWRKTFIASLGDEGAFDLLAEQILDHCEKILARAYRLRNMMDTAPVETARLYHSGMLRADIAQLHEMGLEYLARAVMARPKSGEWVERQEFQVGPCSTAECLYRLAQSLSNNAATLLGASTAVAAVDTPRTLKEELRGGSPPQ